MTDRQLEKDCPRPRSSQDVCGAHAGWKLLLAPAAHTRRSLLRALSARDRRLGRTLDYSACSFTLTSAHQPPSWRPREARRRTAEILTRTSLPQRSRHPRALPAASTPVLRSGRGHCPPSSGFERKPRGPWRTASRAGPRLTAGELHGLPPAPAPTSLGFPPRWRGNR